MVILSFGYLLMLTLPAISRTCLPLTLQSRILDKRGVRFGVSLSCFMILFCILRTAHIHKHTQHGKEHKDKLKKKNKPNGHLAGETEGRERDKSESKHPRV